MDQIKELKARLLGISSFPDKIVQESIRMVLNAIYDMHFLLLRKNVVSSLKKSVLSKKTAFFFRKRRKKHSFFDKIHCNKKRFLSFLSKKTF